MNTVLEMSVKRLGLELETGGNVRFEDGKISDPWYVKISKSLSKFVDPVYPK